MKRGLISWNKTELPSEAFESRLNPVRAHLKARSLPALAIYSDLWKSNQGRCFTNFMPYFNRAFSVIPQDGKPFLLCGLSPRVYPWIQSVTIFEEVVQSPNLAAQLRKISADRGWKRIGVMDLEGLPYDLFSQLRAGEVQIEDVEYRVVHPSPDQWEIAMHRRAAELAKRILAEELPQGTGLSDHEFVGRLERRYRREGAEDLIVLVTNGETPPAPPTGATLEPGFSVCVALEYRGHWTRIAQTQSVSTGSRGLRRDDLSGPYPWTPSDQLDLRPGTIFSAVLEFQEGGKRYFRGDTQHFKGIEPL